MVGVETIFFLKYGSLGKVKTARDKALYHRFYEENNAVDLRGWLFLFFIKLFFAYR